MTKIQNKIDNPLASLLIILSTLSFTIMSALVKNLTTVNIEQVVFFRCFIALLFGLIFIFKINKSFKLKTKHFKLHFSRSFIGISAMFCLFMAYRSLDLAQAYSLGESKNIFISIFAVYFLKERITLERVFAVLIGFVGVIIMLDPSAPKINIGTIYALSGAVLASLALMFVKTLTKYDHPLVIVNYFMLIGSIVSGIFIFFNFKSFYIPSYSEFLQLILIGFSGIVGQILLVFSFKKGDSSYIAPFAYSGLIWATVIGYFVWSEIPSFNIIIGALIIIGSQLYLHYKENKVIS